MKKIIYNNIFKEIKPKRNSDYETFDILSLISKQKENNVCKIIKENNNFGTGFLCLIPYPDKLNLLPVLISCNHILNNDDIKIGKEIILLFNDKITKIIKIDESRKVYSSDKNEYNITFIEIKKDDGFDINNMLDIDYDIFKEEKLIRIYKNKRVYIIHYPDNVYSIYSTNIIKSIDCNNVKFKYLCETEEMEEGSCGAPIINLNNFKVMGVHIGKYKHKGINIGTVLRRPIEAFNELKNLNNQKNFIILKIKVTNDDINKEIYFLDNSNNLDENINQKNCHTHLNELNELNTKLYINNIEYKYKKYFIPEREGIYSIKLELNISIKDCSYMFFKCHNTINIYLSSFNSKNVTNMNEMFSLCTNLTDIDFSNFNTKNVSDMGLMFQGCSKLNNIDLSSFDTRNVTNMCGMFSCCSELTNLDLSSFDTKNVKNMNQMFYWCPKLINLNLSSFNINYDIINIGKMFKCCNSLIKIKINKNFYRHIKDKNELNDSLYEIINE